MSPDKRANKIANGKTTALLSSAAATNRGAPNTQGHAARTSPCLKLCTLETQTGFCSGCYRSLAEIRDWPLMSDAAREAVLALLPQRAQGLV